MDTYIKTVDGYVNTRSIISAHPLQSARYRLIILMSGELKETAISDNEGVRKLMEATKAEGWIEAHPREFLNLSAFGGVLIYTGANNGTRIQFYLAAGMPLLGDQYGFEAAEATKIIAALASR